MIDPIDPFDRVDTNKNPDDSQKEGICQKIDNLCKASEKLCNFLFTISKILLLLVVLVLAFRIISNDQGIVVQSLNNVNEANISDIDIANRLQFELQKIKKINEQTIKYGTSPNATLNTNAITPVELEETYRDSGIISIGGISLSPIQTLLFIKDVFRGNKEKSLTIEFQRFGSNISILAILHSPSKGIITWEERRILSQDNQSVEDLIPAMIDDLAYKISYDLINKDKKLSWIYPKTLPAFVNQTRTREAYLKYKVTNNLGDLNETVKLIIAKNSDQVDSESSKLLYKIGNIYLENKIYDKSEELFKIVNDNNPDLSAIGLGRLYSAQNDYNDAIKVLDNAINNNPKNKWLLLNKGCILEKNGNHAGAIHCFDQVIQNSVEGEEEYSCAWDNKGLVYINSGRYQEALDACNTSINARPNYAKAFATRGYAYRGLNELDKAEESFNKSRELEYKFADY